MKKCDCYPYEHCPICDPKFFRPESPNESKQFKQDLLTFLHEKAEEQRKCAESWAKENPVDLLPCPFCGETVHFIKSYVWGEGGSIIHRKKVSCIGDTIASALTPEGDKELLNKWNTRTPNTQQQIHSRASNSFQEVITYIENNP